MTSFPLADRVKLLLLRHEFLGATLTRNESNTNDEILLQIAAYGIVIIGIEECNRLLVFNAISESFNPSIKEFLREVTTVFVTLVLVSYEGQLKRPREDGMIWKLFFNNWKVRCSRIIVPYFVRSITIRVDRPETW